MLDRIVMFTAAVKSYMIIRPTQSRFFSGSYVCSTSKHLNIFRKTVKMNAINAKYYFSFLSIDITNIMRQRAPFSE